MILSPSFRALMIVPVTFILAMNFRVSINLIHHQNDDHAMLQEPLPAMRGTPAKNEPVLDAAVSILVERRDAEGANSPKDGKSNPSKHGEDAETLKDEEDTSSMLSEQEENLGAQQEVSKDGEDTDVSKDEEAKDEEASNANFIENEKVDNPSEHTTNHISFPQKLLPVASIDDPDTFAGCLQIMDDNHFLIEWLAYHYHVMPLRRLIVLADPYSKTTPQPILDRWKDRMNITLWKEEDVFPHGINYSMKNMRFNNATKLARHRHRQKKFLLACMKSLKKEGRGWVLLTDTDEYTMINDRYRTPTKYGLHDQNVSLPSQDEPGSVMKLLQQNLARDPVSNRRIGDIPCITMARREFSTREMGDSEEPETLHGFKTANLQTFHWRFYHTLFKPGKALLHLPNVEYNDFPAEPSVHRPIRKKKNICVGKVALTEQQSLLTVNHYPGNLKQMLFRDVDARGDATNATAYRVERFNALKRLGRLKDSYRIQWWLLGFIATVGENRAKDLLENVGLPNEAATFLDPEDLLEWKEPELSVISANNTPVLDAGSSVVVDSSERRETAGGLNQSLTSEIVSKDDKAADTWQDGEASKAKVSETESQAVGDPSEQAKKESDFVKKQKNQNPNAIQQQYNVESPANYTNKPDPQMLQQIAAKADPDTFAGCLQIMDDNHFLIEWLAYHYHVMPLRRLIVLMDPFSKTTPQPILDRWKDRMDITLWQEKDVFPKGIPLPRDRTRNITKVGRHRVRQKTFLSTCMKSLKAEGRGWVLLTDTDEYTMINDRLGAPTSNQQNVSLPLQKEPGSVIKLLQQNLTRDPVSGNKTGDFPCIRMARRTFSTREINKTESDTTHGFKTGNLQTLHWRFYSGDWKLGKTILNLQRLKYDDFSQQVSVHRPAAQCVYGKVSLNEQQSILAVNHYPGNLDQMLFRDMDARGEEAGNATAYRIERFQSLSRIGKFKNQDGIQEWLPGFISTVGEKKAMDLLENVGLPNEAATFLTPEEIRKIQSAFNTKYG